LLAAIVAFISNTSGCYYVVRVALGFRQHAQPLGGVAKATGEYKKGKKGRSTNENGGWTAQSDIYWKHPLTAEFYHNVDKSSEKFADEAILADFLKKHTPHILIDLGIGTGRELNWLRDVETTRAVIGIDYSPHMLDKCREIWRSYPKKLVLLLDDFEKLQKLEKVLRREHGPAVFICLSNTLGNLPSERRKKAVAKIGTVARPGDLVIFALYKRVAGRKQYTEEIKYYKKYYRTLETVVKAIYGIHATYKYDETGHDILVGTNEEPIFISHRWAKGEIAALFSSTCLRLEDILEGDYTFFSIGKKF